MKAPWLIFSLLFAISLSNAQAQQKKRVKLPSSERAQIDQMLEKLETSYGKAETEPRVSIGQHKKELTDIVEGLYRKGFVTLEQLNQFIKLVDQNASSLLCVPTAPKECGQGLKDFFNNFYDKEVKYKEPYCGQKGEVASVKQCCGDLKRLPFAGFKPNKCAPSGNSCSSHGECCSQFCNKNADGSAGTCSPVFSCYELKKAGQECPPESPYCESDLSCLEIDYNSSGVGECKDTGSSCSANVDCCSDKCSNGKCVDKSLCLDCAKLGQKPKANQECCPGSYKGLNGACIQDFPPLGFPTSVKAPRKKNAFENLVVSLIDFIIPSARADDDSEPNCDGIGEDGLTDLQRTGPDGYETCIGNVMRNYDTQEEIARELQTCQDVKKAHFRENEDCKGEAFTRTDWKHMYQMPHILSQTFSDVKKCEFNSHNDSWKAKTAMAKNAELALMAFETTYSGKGQDLIIAGPGVSSAPEVTEANGYSIFSRAKKLATKLRRNRHELVENFKELDIRMTCKCLAVFGPNKFNSEKQAFFNDKCDEEKKYVTEQFIQGNNNEGQQNDQSDGHDNEESSEAEEIDKGAVGISHEKLLVEWLGMRRDLQMQSFQNNEGLEEEMQELSEFVSGYQWIENNNTRPEQGERLYQFKVKYNQFWSFVLGLVSIIAIGAAIFLTGGAALLVGLAAVAAGAGAVALYNGSVNDPAYYDHKVDSNRSWGGLNPLNKYDKYDRYLVFPYTEGPVANTDVPGNEQCKVWGEADKCIKSVYFVNHVFDSGAAYEKWPLFDVAMPLTVPESAYIVEKTPAPNETYVKLLEEAYEYGRSYLIANKPAGYEYDDDHGLYWDSGEYEDSAAEGLLPTEEHVKAFLVKKGEWQPKLFEVHKDAFIQGVAKYALCKKLTDCAQHSTSDLTEEDIGLGYLFEQVDDAEEFAKYVYSMHLIWPRLARDEKIAYPTFGMDAYFQLMSFNLRVAGSLALRTVYDTGELYDLYKADWEKRRRDYQGLGGAEEGGGSSNVELNDRFFSAIQRLDFQNGVNMEQFSALMDNLEQSEDLTPDQRKALSAINRHAIRNQKAREKKAHFDKTVGSTERGKRKAAAASKFMESFNSPLRKMNLNVGGENLGMTSSSSAAPSPSLSNLKKNGKGAEGANSKEKGHQASYSPSSSYSAGTASYGSSSSRYGSGSGSESSLKSGSLNSGLSNSEAELMVNAAKKDPSLEEVLPDDTIWRVVSKAYKRNLSRVLVLKSEIQEKKNAQGAKAKTEISKGEKDELKQLLKNEL